MQKYNFPGTNEKALVRVHQKTEKNSKPLHIEKFQRLHQNRL